MHRTLKRQLKKAGIPAQSHQRERTMQKLLEMVSHKYEADEARGRLLRRSLKLSSDEMKALYQQLQQRSKERLNTMFSVIPDLVVILNPQYEFVDIFDEGKAQLLYRSKEESLGQTVYDIFPAELAQRFAETLRRAMETGTMQRLQYTLDVPLGHRMFEARVLPVDGSIDTSSMLMALVRDITDQHEGARNARLLETAFMEATEGVLIEDEHRNAVFANPAMEKILGLAKSDILGKHSDFFSAMLASEAREMIRLGMETRGFWHGETKISRFDGKEILVWLNIDAVEDDLGALANIVISVTDISELRESRERLEHQATHDILTDLPNRSLFLDRLKQATMRCSRQGNLGAVLFVDLDGFKDVNDNFGHESGDTVLTVLAGRLKSSVRSVDTVARIGGDEFVISLEGIRVTDELLKIVKKVMHNVSQPIPLVEHEIIITCSIGISIFPNDSSDPSKLLNFADIAMYSVKKRGKNNFGFYSERILKSSKAYFAIDNGIRQAIRAKAFHVHYQPQIHLQNGALIGAEALLRPDGYYLPKQTSVARIIEIAQESEAIIRIGEWMIEQVCTDLREWMDAGIPSVFSVAVNLSRREICSEGFAKKLIATIDGFGIDTARIEFEITERAVISSHATARENLDQLQNAGYRLSIDDYGTGFSSLLALNRFNPDKLKIDRVFVDKIASSGDDRIIVDATIGMAKKLGLQVLAEGVETDEQVAILSALGCDDAQGYHFSKPMCKTDMAALLRSAQEA